MRPVAGDDGVLHWSGRVLSAQELERLRRDLHAVVLEPGTVITPSARDWLREHGVSVTTQIAEAEPAKATGWRWAQERPFAAVESVLDSLGRDGVTFEPWSERGSSPVVEWSSRLAEEVGHGNCRGAVVFCQDPALACCVANKLVNVRGAAIATVPQAERALKTLGANWLAVEMPGRSFFELRRMLRLAAVSRGECPADLAKTLAELGTGGCACGSPK